jgi:NADPH:quinone reductase-like Zn-dependent oxidoreductase
MKAITHREFGPPDVIQLEETEKPAPNETRGVLVKVYASSVNAADRYNLIGPPFILRLFLPLFRLNTGVRKPRDPRLGTDFSGRVEAVSPNVTQFKPGDEVFGVCPGAYADYATARENLIALKPANCSHEEAAATGIAAFTALQGLRDHGHIQPGQKVLVNGAGGGVGTFAVQIAKAFGAEVTAATSTENLDLVRKIGADHVIDYTKEDFTKTGQQYDLICDIAATHSFTDFKRALNPNGTCVIIGYKDKIVARLLYFVMLRPILGRGDKKFKFFIAKSDAKDFAFLGELIEKGRLVPVIDKRFPLAQTADAIRYFAEEHPKGKVVITVPSNQTIGAGP